MICFLVQKADDFVIIPCTDILYIRTAVVWIAAGIESRGGGNVEFQISGASGYQAGRMTHTDAPTGDLLKPDCATVHRFFCRLAA